MNLHQVLTGAVNPGDNCFSVGGMNNHPFTAYASGCDIVILGSDFERLQIIPGAKHGNIQVGCVDSSLQGGQVRGKWGSWLLPNKLSYQWQKTGQFVLQSVVRNLAWDPTGTHLLTGSASLQLWSNMSRGLNEDGEASDLQCPWRCIWHCKTASPIQLMKFSPDGEFFATAGQDDCLVKIWYNTSKWHSSVTKLFTPPEHASQGELNFSFVYLAHPRSVTGFSWRKTSKYMPRGSVCNVLLTCCKDSVCRLWAETLLPSDSLLSGHTLSHVNNGLNGDQGVAQPSLTGLLPCQQSRHHNHKANAEPHANALCHFHIAASINPATDIPLLPSITSLCGGDEEEPGGPFTVHWLNNKELHLTLAMEVFLQQLRGSVEQSEPERSEEGKAEGHVFKLMLDLVLDRSKQTGKRTICFSEDPEEVARRGPDPASVQLPAAVVEHQVEVLLEDWNRGADMLFSIHPMDGSLLVWHVDWLDEYQPGMFRQVQVSFVSRIPVAFPTGDANSLSRSVVMYACNKNVDLAVQHGRQRPAGLPHSSSVLVPYGPCKASPAGSLRLSIFTPNVLMISTHADGSLNQWAVSFAEDSAFSAVLSVSHKSRYCGHRFHLNDLACHSLLPLLLTTSHHNALRSPDVDAAPALASSSLGVGPGRGSPGVVSQDPNAIYSELILWRVDPVGPLSFSGGVSELARINSLHSSAFSNIAWLPALIPSSCLGVYCNSPSACFVASDGHSLRLYQAVIEAKKLLGELSNPERSKYVGKVFNIISQQSTAKPGCIIELDAITEFVSTQELKKEINASQTGFSARFFLVVVEFTQTARSVLHMWRLQLAARPITMGVENATSTPTNGSFDFEAFSAPFVQRNKACTSSLQSASRLTLTTQRLYSQELVLPKGVEVISVTPSAGHLSASSLQPAGGAPYLLATSCSDGKVRFWRCRVSAAEPDTREATYTWEEWPLLVEEGLGNSSTLNVSGRPVEVSCCHTSRIAVAYRHNPNRLSPNPQPAARETQVHVGIFQCESTGGSQWVLEQTLVLDASSPLGDGDVAGGRDSPSVLSDNPNIHLPGNDCLRTSGRSLVHLDWVSREDGSHILTVGIGSKLYMYGLLSGRPAELGLSEGSRGMVSSRLVLLRSVDLVSSVEGSLPIPVSLSWVRDGILVVGMDCEMHVYSQWQPPAKSVASSGAGKLSGKRTVYDLPAEMEDYGLFEAAHHLFPTLPQYHPVQLLELMDLGKVRRAKAILSHLVKCIAGEIVALKDNATNQEKRFRSRTISAGGSTTRDPKFLSKGESSDYTEIDSIPPLPLYALLAADEDCSPKPKDKEAKVSSDSGHGSSQTDAYDELFQGTGAGVDELEPLDQDQEESSGKVIDLSRYSPTFFGPEHAQVLSSHLLHSSLPGLTRMEQMSLMALADTIATTSTDIGESHSGETLDECGLKFLLAVRLHMFLLTTLPQAHRGQLLHQGRKHNKESLWGHFRLSTGHYVWAFHSEAEEELLNMLPAMQKGDPTWPELRAMGVGWWLRSTNKLRRCIEKVAKASFQRQNDPMDAALFYLAMKKKAVVWGLYRSQNNAKMTAFFNNNFGEDRWRKAALKNAFSLLGKQRFQHSAAFFLLAGSLKDAVEVCVEKMQDLQLALVISRLHESEFEMSSTYKRILQRHVLGQDRQLPAHQDPFLRSMAHWVMEDYSRALDTLLVQPPTRDSQTTQPGNPEVFNFYTYLRTHPLLLRRHFGSSEKAKVCLTAEGCMAHSISLVERRLFFTAAYAHLQAGCPMLALDVLSKMPKVLKRSTPQADDPASPALSERKYEQASHLDWSRPMLNGSGSVSESLSNSQSDSVLSFDWSQPSLAVQDEALELKWDSDKEDEDDELQGLVMKSTTNNNNSSVFQEAQEAVSPLAESPLDNGDDALAPSEDILAAQLKFSACLKILTTELRTLSTGYELDGGKLRYQLCQWLEREVVALQRCCSYKPCMAGPGVVEEEEGDRAQPGEAQRTRRHWLQSNQPLLRMFLSYCSLHGSHGGGLASVRMELILLLLESQQDDSVQSAVAPYLHHASIPLLLACTASSKTVVANPMVHLTNLTHDILHTFNALDSPPHPDIYVMHTLAASLSACIYQCLCNGHNYSHVNQFTGIVYQSILLSHQNQGRTTSIEETVNSHPAQWPGISALVRLMDSSGDEGQPGLAVLLCEILTAVFLGLFVHGLATHSSNELFRVVAHPLNSKLWVAVFGGGARTHVVEKPSPVRSPGLSSCPSGEDSEKTRRRRFKLMSSSRGASREGPESPGPTSPVVEQEASIFKEHFVPPELSIWDYFIAKPFLPPSLSRMEYDSEESQESEDEEDWDHYQDFDPNSPGREHSNHNSYSMCRYLPDLPVGSPLCHAVLKTLQRWEQVLLKRLEIFGGPPSKYISTPPVDETNPSGPAILRHKALFEPSNTPFRSSHHSVLPVKRLWQYLVKQEEVQDTFIRNIFAKKRDPNESVEDHNENYKCSETEEPSCNQMEADLGHPGGKARIIHKDSDIITAFAINKANRNCLVMASTHDIQELDVSSILATQIMTWIEDDAEAEVKGCFSWILSAASLYLLQLIKRNINNVRRMTSHPTLPYYLTGAQDGSVRMFEWGHSQQIICFRSPGNCRVTRIRFNHQGNKFGIVDADGALSLWQTNTTGNTPKPYLTLQCHNKTAHDFVFVGSSSLIATAGLSTDNRNVCLWDTLVTPMNSLVHAFSCHESGATVLSLAPKQQLLITGGRKGWISVLELPHKQQRQSFQAHDSPVKALAVDPTEDCFISGSAEGNIKVWSLSTQSLLHQFPNEHARQSLFRNLGTGVMQIEVGPANHIFSCGADGTMKMRILPERFSDLISGHSPHICLFFP
uniref:RAVE complex protein Rav1 C-terminal domain-containing protein n=1 Tax=Esox lucius TaxID=8010 RepID=A0A3P9AEL0_ESOLU